MYICMTKKYEYSIYVERQRGTTTIQVCRIRPHLSTANNGVGANMYMYITKRYAYRIYVEKHSSPVECPLWRRR